jgi:VIT1/CCC1 family predicted Fe2+/Mn2+ transporter
VTLNIRLTLDGPLPAAAREAPAEGRDLARAAALDTSAPGGLAPALLLSSLCAIVSMALAVIAPILAAQLIPPHWSTFAPLAAPILVLLLTLAAFGLGYLWGRGRRPTGAGNARSIK